MDDRQFISVQFFSVPDKRDLLAAKVEKREPKWLQDLKYAKEGDACVDICL